MAKRCPKCESDNPGTSNFCADCGNQLPSLAKEDATETIVAAKEELTTGSTFAERKKFLGLWKDADPGIDEVQDARKILAGLKEE